MPQNDPKILLVEGKTDAAVVGTLCQSYHLPKTFEIEVMDNLENLLKDVPVRLKGRDFQSLGILVDADQDIASRWQAVSNVLQKAGYTPPATPLETGFISPEEHLPTVGVWVLPNNQAVGMLEDFALSLIPADDDLLPHAEAILKTLEAENLNRYRPIHRPKALIHTWLAWQKNPGRPLGTAITSRYLQAESPSAQKFVAWLQRLFQPVS